MKNYGDKRIVEFLELAVACDKAYGLNSYHWAYWNNKAQKFSDHHTNDPYWQKQEEVSNA